MEISAGTWTVDAHRHLIMIDVHDDQQARAGDQQELDAVEEHSHERRAAPRATRTANGVKAYFTKACASPQAPDVGPSRLKLGQKRPRGNFARVLFGTGLPQNPQKSQTRGGRQQQPPAGA